MADFRPKSTSVEESLCVKTVSGKVVRHLLPWLSVKNDWWGRPILPEILDQTGRVGAKSPIFDAFSLAATEP